MYFVVAREDMAPINYCVCSFPNNVANPIVHSMLSHLAGDPNY